MIPFLIGLVCLLAAWRALSPDRARPQQNAWLRERTGLRAAAWVGAIAALVLFQLWSHREAIARYRISLTGLRYALTDQQGYPIRTPLRVSGDYEEADLYVPRIGQTDVAHVRLAEGSTTSLTLGFPDDAGALALVEDRLAFGRSRWRIPTALRVGEDDTITVRGRGQVHRLTVRSVPHRLRILGIGIPIRWADRHVIDMVGDTADAPQSLPLPVTGTRFSQRLRGVPPSFFARSYPLADVLEALDTAAARGLPPLTSFFFYDNGALHLAEVDSEVEVTAPNTTESAREAGTLTLHQGRTGSRLLIAALPLRDYPELELTLPERYGIRPLRTVELTVRGEWLDVNLATPEVQSLDGDALESLRLPGVGPDDANYRIRLSHARNALAPQAVVFEAPARAFETASQAILELDRNPRASHYEIMTPAGLASAPTGQTVPLGSRERSILLRVDGQGTSPTFWLILIALFMLAGSVFYFRPVPGPIFALAICAVGFGAIRLLLGTSALLEYPFVPEAHQIGLWLLPALPWTVVLAAELARGPFGGREVAFHGALAAALATLTLVLFADSPAKQLALSLVPATLFAMAVWNGRPPVPVQVPMRMRGRTRMGSSLGWSLGLTFFLVRVLLELMGWREGVMLGGTRIAWSVVYSPLALIAFAVVLHRHAARIAQVDVASRDRAVALAFMDSVAFLGLTYVATALWISDFGIVLVGMPAVLLVLALLGVHWTRGLGYAAAATFALPFVLFAIVQSSPRLLHTDWRVGGGAEGRMGEWNRNELLLLERGDPDALRRIGERRSEALAVMRETMRSYTRGNWFGKGFLDGRVSNEIESTAVREHTVSALLASQWGLAGALGLVLLLLIIVLPLHPGGAVPGMGNTRAIVGVSAALFAVLLLPALGLPQPFGTLFTTLGSVMVVGAFVLPAARATVARASVPGENAARTRAPETSAAANPFPLHATIAALFLLTLAGTGLYMVLANYGLVLFTGKNVYFFGLDSVGDALEGLILLAGGAAALAFNEYRSRPLLDEAVPPSTGALELTAPPKTLALRAPASSSQ